MDNKGHVLVAMIIIHLIRTVHVFKPQCMVLIRVNYIQNTPGSSVGKPSERVVNSLLVK